MDGKRRQLAHSFSVQDWPVSLRAQLFGHLDVQTLCHARVVCKAWTDQKAAWTSWNPFLGSTWCANSDNFGKFMKMACLNSVKHISHCTLWVTQASTLAPLSQVRSICNVRFKPRLAVSANEIAQCFANVSLYKHEITDYHNFPALPLPKLRRLILNKHPDAVLQASRGSLQHVHLKRSLSFETIAHLSLLTRLETLHVGVVKSLDFSALAQLSRLNDVTFEFRNADVAVLRYLGRFLFECANLRKVAISFTPGYDQAPVPFAIPNDLSLLLPAKVSDLTCSGVLPNNTWARNAFSTLRTLDLSQLQSLPRQKWDYDKSVTRALRNAPHVKFLAVKWNFLVDEQENGLNEILDLSDFAKLHTLQVHCTTSKNLFSFPDCFRSARGLTRLAKVVLHGFVLRDTDNLASLPRSLKCLELQTCLLESSALFASCFRVMAGLEQLICRDCVFEEETHFSFVFNRDGH